MARSLGRGVAATAVLLLTGLALVGLISCSRFHAVKTEHVYVSARQVYLHDRVAAVSNRVGMVTNGESLEVIERGKRFVKVRTPKGEVGWLEDHAIIDQDLYSQFEALAQKHAGDAVVAVAQLRDDLYLHVAPGRETAHFLVIPGNGKVQMLARGTVPKKSAPGLMAPARPSAMKPLPVPASNQPAAQKPKKSTTPAVAAPTAVDAQAPPVPMEDWWLVRDNAGHTGWLLAGRLDVDIPEEVGGYAEGARMVGAYPLAKVYDTEVEHKAARKGARPETNEAAAPQVSPDHIEYVTVLSPVKNGLPYDFDQVRVFTWSLNHHRYETGFRLRGIQGYLPVRIGKETVNGYLANGQKANGQTAPTFTFQIASGPNVSIDPDTGVTRPVNPRTIAFRLEGNLVRRTGADQAPITAPRDGDAGKSRAGASASGKGAKKKAGKKRR